MCSISVLKTKLCGTEDKDHWVPKFSVLSGVLMVLFASSLFSSPLLAVEVKGLYNAEALVIDQSRSVRISAAQDALAEVLIRVSGAPQILLDQSVRRELLKPDVYLLQYSYAISDQTMINQAGNEVPAKQLLLSFDPSLVQKLLKEAELPIWGTNRARVLVWWGVENQGNRYLLSAENRSNDDENSIEKGFIEEGAYSDSSVLDQLYREATRRGLPVTLPLMDLQDSSAVKTSDVWGFFTENIEVASRRYGPEAILVGRAMPSLTGEWLGSWMLLLDGRSHWFEGTASSVDLLLMEAVDNVADELGKKYGVFVREDSSLGIVLKVFDIQELKDYAAVSSYLDALVPVRKAHLRQVDGDILTFSILLDGDMEQLKQAIALNDKLLPVVGVPRVASRPSGQLLPEGYVDTEEEVERESIVQGMYLEYRWVGE